MLRVSQAVRAEACRPRDSHMGGMFRIYQDVHALAAWEMPSNEKWGKIGRWRY